MKKSLLVVFCGIILVAALVLGACGNKKAAAKSSDPQTLLEAYLNEQVNQEAFESLNESMESLGLTMEVYADGSSVVYKYTYTEIPSTTSGIAESIQGAMVDQADSIAAAVEQIETEVGLDGVTMVYNYYGSDGELICSATYSSEGLVK